MRVCVAGAGLAGSLLAWRLVRRPGVRITLVGAGSRAAGATAASGGLLRGFEPGPHNAALAMRSIAELTESATLTRWARARFIGSMCICRAPAAQTLRQIEATMPDSLGLASPAQLAARYGFSGLPADSIGVVERIAGYFSPGNLARMAVQEVVACGGVVVTDPLRCWRVADDGSVCFGAGATSGVADVVVLAAGAWTGELLRLGGFTEHGWRTKLIQYGVYRGDGAALPAFVEESTGLYGRCAGPHHRHVLLGLPTTAWGVSPAQPRFLPELERSVRQQASALLPTLAVGELVRRVAAVDSYTCAARLALRPVAPPMPVYTFAGGSGSGAKTALAASADAAEQLIDLSRPRPPASPHRRDRAAT